MIDACSRFASPEGDHVTLLNVFRGYTNTKQKKVWCHDNFLHHRNLEYAVEVRHQLAALADRANLERASCGTSTDRLRKALLEGLHDNLAELQRDQTYVTVSESSPPLPLFSPSISGPNSRVSRTRSCVKVAGNLRASDETEVFNLKNS